MNQNTGEPSNNEDATVKRRRKPSFQSLCLSRTVAPPRIIARQRCRHLSNEIIKTGKGNMANINRALSVGGDSVHYEWFPGIEKFPSKFVQLLLGRTPRISNEYDESDDRSRTIS